MFLWETNQSEGRQRRLCGIAMAPISGKENVLCSARLWTGKQSISLSRNSTLPPTNPPEKGTVSDNVAQAKNPSQKVPYLWLSSFASMSLTRVGVHGFVSQKGNPKTGRFPLIVTCTNPKLGAFKTDKPRVHHEMYIYIYVWIEIYTTYN